MKKSLFACMALLIFRVTNAAPVYEVEKVVADYEVENVADASTATLNDVFEVYSFENYQSFTAGTLESPKALKMPNLNIEVVKNLATKNKLSYTNDLLLVPWHLNKNGLLKATALHLYKRQAFKPRSANTRQVIPHTSGGLPRL